MSINAMKLALVALETCRIRSVSEWSVEDITPKNVTAAIAALRTAIQQPAQAVNEKHFGDFELLVVTTAYEQGFGHAFRTELSNPYAPATNAYEAWDMGRSAGKRNGQPQQPATGEPVGQVSDLFPSVRNKLHAKGFDSDAPLYTRPAPSVPKDDQIAALVNKVRDIARMFNDHRSLRERIAIELVPALKVSQEVKSDAEWYRFIRDGSGWPAVFAAHDAPEPLRGDALDDAIAAAMPPSP